MVMDQELIIVNDVNVNAAGWAVNRPKEMKAVLDIRLFAAHGCWFTIKQW